MSATLWLPELGTSLILNNYRLVPINIYCRVTKGLYEWYQRTALTALRLGVVACTSITSMQLLPLVTDLVGFVLDAGNPATSNLSSVVAAASGSRVVGDVTPTTSATSGIDDDEATSSSASVSVTSTSRESDMLSPRRNMAAVVTWSEWRHNRWLMKPSMPGTQD